MYSSNPHFLEGLLSMETSLEKSSWYMEILAIPVREDWTGVPNPHQFWVIN